MPYKNKEDRKRYSERHYQENKSAYLKRSKSFNDKVKKEIREYLNEYLTNHSCVDCGESDIVVLEFDHVRGIKSGNIADYGNRGWSLLTIKKEIDKCDVRCANCHRRMTNKRKMQ